MVYDSATRLYWLQDGNYAGADLTLAAAQSWAASLQVPGIGGGWQLPSQAQFSSLYSQFTLAHPHDEAYGTVPFGPGANDHVLNAQIYYWAADPVSGGYGAIWDTYGYPGSPALASTPESVWVVATVVPEPGTVGAGLGALALAAAGLVRRPRQP